VVEIEVRKEKYMDPDSNYNDEQKETSNSVPNDRHVFESNGIRRDSIDLDTYNRFLIESEFRIILPCVILFWIIFFLFGK